ncbi:AraC family transcriptional regulator [uncultured Ruminococcus sp.]|uniref:AraC family transcriptional regulator n=1 Tax=uncultured Ruminococcus sp. TaxID=165186 RepID=UPI00261B2733|nr:AraC family transcriptional regulator [uncultured Ruminococcus sp.]
MHTVKMIARHFHYNAEYLSLIFKKETGCTLIKYLSRIRIDIAKRLLEMGGTEPSVQFVEMSPSNGRTLFAPTYHTGILFVDLNIYEMA